MSTTKKTGPKTTSAKINKSAWIRSQPASMSAKDVFEKAKAEGIKLSVAQVYTARSSAKKAGKSSKPKGKAGRPTGSKTIKAEIAGDLTAIRRAVFEHGFSKVESFLAELKKSVGL
ncbi:MAG TPA: hypothetical protein VF331_22845 [Polyangiales bacterium]